VDQLSLDGRELVRGVDAEVDCAENVAVVVEQRKRRASVVLRINTHEPGVVARELLVVLDEQRSARPD